MRDSCAGRPGTNYHPLVPPPTTFAQRLDARVAEALDKRLVEQVSTGSGRGVARALAFVLVTPVHLAGLALALAGLLLIVRGDGWWDRAIAVFLLALAWVVRPHVLHGVDPDSVRVDPAEAPTYAAFVAEVAELLGTRAPTELRVDGEFNAYVSRHGLRGRQLVIGAPLWVAYGPQERVSLLGHELGHLAHGDLLSRAYVDSAYRALIRWIQLLDPADSEVFWNDTPLLVRAATAPPRWLVLGYLRLLDALNAASGRRQELYADLAAALAAGTEAAVSDHEVILLSEAIDVVSNRAAMDATRPPIGEAIIERVAAYDAGQRAANRRAAADDRRRIDARHPPTVDRLRLVESVEHSLPTIVLDPARSRRIDQELAPALDEAFKRLGDAYRYVH